MSGRQIMPNIVVVGATGLVGSALVRLIGTRSDVRATALVRRRGDLERALGTSAASNINERVFDFTQDSAYARLGSDDIPCDILLCAIGTTMRKAGSRQAFLQVDYEIPARLMARAQKISPPPVFGLVSATGAERPFGFYLETKARVEATLRASKLPHVIVRPSLLLGERKEHRLGEGLMSVVMPPITGAMSALTGSRIALLGRILPIDANALARALFSAALSLFEQPSAERSSIILEGYPLHEQGRVASS